MSQNLINSVGRQASTFTTSSLLLPLAVNKWCHQLTESMIPVKEPRKTSPTPAMTF